MKRMLCAVLAMLLVFACIGANAEGYAKADPMTVVFFVGGDPGDAFGTIVEKGAKAAAEMLGEYGVTVEYLYSGWDAETMVNQLRETIARKPEAICMMGHPGDDALMGLAGEAKDAGIIMTYVNVDVPIVRSQFGGGYVGPDNASQGAALGQEAINKLGLKEGDRVVVFGDWGVPGRFVREEASANAYEAAGIIVERIVSPTEAGSDPMILLPYIAAQLETYPETKMIQFAGSQTLGSAKTFMEACGKKAGEVYTIGFDISDEVLSGIEDGFIHLTGDQQPFAQGFLSVLSVYLNYNYQLALLEVDTGAGFVDINNYQQVLDLAKAGYR